MKQMPKGRRAESVTQKKVEKDFGVHLRSGIAVHNCSFTWRFQKAVAKWASR